MLKRLIGLIKDNEFKHPEKAKKTQQEKRPVDDEYELLKYSLLLRSDCPLIDVVGKDTFDNLICIWFADVHTLTPDQKKLNEELLIILKDFPDFSDHSGHIIDRYITRLKGFFRKNQGNDDLKTVLNLERGESRLTVLHLVSSINDPVVEECMDLLLEAGAEVNKKDDRGKTPLHYAAYSGCGKSVGLLLKKGALSTPDEQGEIPLDVAICSHNYDVEELLLTDEQKSLKEKLYSALKDDGLTELKKLLNEHNDTQNLRRVLNLHDDEKRSKVLQFVRSIPHEEAERLLLGAGAIDCKGLDRKEHLSQSRTLWDNLILNQQERLRTFLEKVKGAQGMKELEQVVSEAIEFGVRLNLPNQGKLYGKAYESKYCFADYVIRKISDLKKRHKTASDIEVASNIACKLVLQGAVLHNINSMCILDELEEFEGHKANMKEAFMNRENRTLKFMEIAKSAATGNAEAATCRVKDFRMDNSALYLEYSEDSTIHVAKITDGARNLGLTQGSEGYGRNIIKIGKSEVEIIMEKGIRNYTDLADGSDIVLTFHTRCFGELEVRLYPDKENKSRIRVEVKDQEMLKKLEDCEEEIGKNCSFGGYSVHSAIKQGYFARSGSFQPFETISLPKQVSEEVKAAVKDLQCGNIVNSSLSDISLFSPVTESIRQIPLQRARTQSC